MDPAWLLALPLLAEVRNYVGAGRRRCGAEVEVYVPARGVDPALRETSRLAVVLRDFDDVCVEERCVKLGTRGKAAAVEYAVENSRGEYVAIFDSDVYFTEREVEALACAAGDGVATGYRVVKCVDFASCLAAAVSDFGFLYMAWRRFIWGGAVAGRRETLRRLYAGVSRHISDDMYATALARRLGVPVRFVPVALFSDPPARTAAGAARWAFRQYALAYRGGDLSTKLGVLAAAAWLVALHFSPPALVALYAVFLARRAALGGARLLLYAAALPIAALLTAAAAASAPFVRKVRWRDRVVELTP